jgi:large subunit ribosomal protein L22
MMEVRAITKYVGISPQKTRWVIDQVRGMQAERALAVLRFMTQSAAEPVAKTIASALANAEENLGLAREDMYITQISADGAPLRRWRRYGARGRFKPIIRRSSHITVILEERGA